MGNLIEEILVTLTFFVFHEVELDPVGSFEYVVFNELDATGQLFPISASQRSNHPLKHHVHAFLRLLLKSHNLNKLCFEVIAISRKLYKFGSKERKKNSIVYTKIYLKKFRMDITQQEVFVWFETYSIVLVL